MNQEVLVERCAVCNLKSSLRCAQCQNTYYCNRDHQRQDWKRHKNDCKKLLKDTERKCVTSPENISENLDVVEEESASKFSHVEISEKGTLPQSKSEEGTSKKVSARNQKTGVVNKKDIGGSDEILHSNNEKIDTVNKSNNVVRTDKEYSASDAITYEGSSENEILSTSTQQLSSSEYGDNNTSNVNVLKTLNRSEAQKHPAMPAVSEHSRAHKDHPEVMLRGNMAPFCHNRNTFVMDSTDPHYEICQSVIRDMSAYGVCVLDNFLGKERGMLVLKEVLDMYRSGIFQAGQLVSNPGKRAEAQTIRSDRITWIDGKEPQCHQIGLLIQQVDNIILRANRLPNNGKMGDYIINGRTKAMVACYPGSGSHYVKHVDNPNKDGRCITAIYYLNLNWDVKACGGLLRVFPEGYQQQVADIAPIFDRVLFFWSDRRNPHEVQPAYNTRYAITLWYFDAIEREEATRRYREKHVDSGAPSNKSDGGQKPYSPL